MKEKFARWDILFSQNLKRDWKKMIVWILGIGLFAAGFVPAFEEMDADYLRQMVHEVNATEVSEQEFLSNNVYFYSFNDDRMVIA